MNRTERCRLSTSTATLTATSTSPGKSKERQKEGKDRETRITNGHLFTSITVSGNTLCYACNKSIITKEAFACPSCSVTIHKTCKDVLSSCTKVKQKQLKAAQAKNNSALHNVSMRHRGPLGRERPNSAVYPSDNLRQSPLFPQLGSRRPRTPFSSLSKSVSTNNIGNLNDDMPLGIRKILSQSTDSLNSRNRSLSIESLIDEGAEMIFQQLMGDLETDKDFAADSWSLAVEAGFLQQQRKDIMKRQDVIYELIQTEVHHVRTLKIMSDIFRRGMVEDLQMEPATAAALFPALDPLLSTHSRFLASLLERRRTSLQPGSSTNFVIAKLGDILLAQFSGKNGDVMRKAYTEFCSRHTKAVKLYKELFTRDKRFQQFVRRMTRCSVLRRHGIQECILLVTQRITKYPVLIERILHNTKGSDAEEVEDLSRALSLVRALIAGVDGEVHESERRCRLQDVCARLDPRASATMHSGQPFQRHHLLQRRLLHDGLVLWKTATGRFKDVQILLLTDVLIFLQEKDQRYSFPTLDNKPAVIPLQKLIVRDIANQEKGMFLISAAAPVPEMYEIHTASLQDRTAWIRVIQRTVNVCPEMEDFSLEIKTKEMLQELSDELRECDGRLLEQLEVKAGLLRRMLALPGSPETPPTAPGPPLLHADTGDPPQAVPLLTLALRQVQSLAELMVGVCGSGGQLLPGYSTEPTPGPLAPGGTDNTGAAPGGSSPDAERPSVNGGPHTGRRETSNITRDGNGNPLKSHNEDVLQRLSQISTLLLSLQAVVVRQDSLLEDQRRRLCERREGPLVGEAERGPGQDHQREELEGLRRQHGLLQQELQRSRRTCDERGLELRALQDRLQQQQQQQQAQGPGDQPRPELEPGHVQVKRRAHSRQFSLPSAPVLAPTQTKVQRRRSADETILGLGLELSGTWAGLADRPPGPLAEEGKGPQGSAGPTTLDEESESESTSSGEESAGDGERLQNVPEDAEPDPGQPAPEGSGSLQPAAEDDDDDYY